MTDLFNKTPSKALPSTNFKPISQDKRQYLGYQYESNGEICGDKRCDYCGEWFTWTIKNKQKYLNDWNWKIEDGKTVKRMIGGKVVIAKNIKNEEPIHCGNSACLDYHARAVKHAIRIANNDKEYINDIQNKMSEGRTRL